jgi:hypothetical protein
VDDKVLPFLFRDRVRVPIGDAVAKRVDPVGGEVAASSDGDGVRSEVGDPDLFTVL